MPFFATSQKLSAELARSELSPNFVQTTNSAGKIEGSKNPCIKKNVGEDQQAIVRELSIKSGNDKEMLATFDAENGTLDPKLQSRVYTKGVREPSFGICQVHRGFHPEIVNDPRFFSDISWQIDQCIKLYRQSKYQFYGHKNIARTLPHFECPA